VLFLLVLLSELILTNLICPTTTAARLGPMRFTDEPAPGYSASPMGTLQVFSVKVAGIKKSLKWPIDVFGVIAARDCIDNNRNVIFSRARDRCQTLTAEVTNINFSLIFHRSVCLLLYCDSAIIIFHPSSALHNCHYHTGMCAIN